jgi:hypothetical protein
MGIRVVNPGKETLCAGMSIDRLEGELVDPTSPDQLPVHLWIVAETLVVPGPYEAVKAGIPAQPRRQDSVDVTATVVKPISLKNSGSVR